MERSAVKMPDLGGIIASCQERLRGFIRRRVPRVQDTEDVLQEVLYNFVRVNTLAQPVEQAAAWLYRAARNEIIDQARKKTEVPLADVFDDDEWPEGENIAETLFSVTQNSEDAYLNELFWYELSAALDELPENQRDVFIKTEFDGCSFKQLAEASGTNVNTLLSRKHAAILHLRGRLQELRDCILDTP